MCGVTERKIIYSMVEVRFVPEFEDGQNLQKLHEPEGFKCSAQERGLGWVLAAMYFFEDSGEKG